MELQFHPGPARKLTSKRITYTSAKCTVNGLLMMGRETARNMYRFVFLAKINLGN